MPIQSSFTRGIVPAGFHHSDLRLANVMEIHSPEDSSQDGQDGRSVVQSPDEARLSGDANALTRDSQDADAIYDKLRHQFKIIDYGLAIFDENFAAGPDVVFEVGSSLQDPIAHKHTQSIGSSSALLEIMRTPRLSV